MDCDVVNLLKAIGYEVEENDGLILEYIAGEVVNDIKANCNIDILPDSLGHVVTNRVCGAFLALKKSGGQLAGLDVEAAVKQIHEGDTSVTYAISDSALTLDNFIKGLQTYGMQQLAQFRRLRW